MLSGELATLLSGRYVNYEILPFGYEEFIGLKKLEKNKKWI
jgi:predicted AAA+ superfamily ATPase